MRALIKALKQTKSDVYAAIEDAIGFKFDRFGETIETNGVKFSWIDGPGNIEITAASSADAKKIKSMLTKGGVMSTIRGVVLSVDHNDYWKD